MTILDSKLMPIPDGLERWLKNLERASGQTVLLDGDAAICVWCQSFGIVECDDGDNEFGDTVTFVYLVGSPAHRGFGYFKNRAGGRTGDRSEVQRDFVTRDEMVKVLRLLYERSVDLNTLGEGFDSLATRLEKRTLP